MSYQRRITDSAALIVFLGIFTTACAGRNAGLFSQLPAARLVSHFTLDQTSARGDTLAQKAIYVPASRGFQPQPFARPGIYK